MFTQPRYLAWAIKHYASASYDLASSGIPAVTWAELGAQFGLTVPNIDDHGGYEALTRSIAKYNDVTPTEVTPALGTSHALFLAYAAILSPGDELLVEHPGYEPLTRAAEGLGATVRTFERRAEDGFRVVPERVAAAMGPRTRAIVVTTLHNPTGVAIDDATLRELAAIADARGAYLVVDEVYAPLEDLPESGVFTRSARKLASNVIAVGSLTKCYGLGLYRLGWVLGSEAITQSAWAAAVATVGHLPLSHASLGVAAFGAVGALAKRAKTLLAGKQAIAEAWVASLPNAQWSAPQAGLFGLVTLPGRGDLLPRIEAHLKETGVLVCAGTFFGLPESFRLSWATCDHERFAAGLRLLEPLCAR